MIYLGFLDAQSKVGAQSRGGNKTCENDDICSAKMVVFQMASIRIRRGSRPLTTTAPCGTDGIGLSR